MSGINDYSTNPDSNTSINGINIAEGCAASNINNAIRQLMADVAGFYTTGALLRANNLSDVADAPTSRNNLGLGTAALYNMGQSGHSVPFLDLQNTWGANQLFPAVWFGDPNCGINCDGTNATFAFDANDYMYYYRPNNTLNFIIANTWQMGLDAVSGLNLAIPLGVAQGGTGGRDAASARAALGLGTASQYNMGTSGHTVPLLDQQNQWGANQFFPSVSLDQYYYASLGSGNPYFVFDNNDFLSYDRVNNFFQWVIGGTTVMNLSPGGMNISPPLPISSGGTGGADAGSARVNLGLGTASLYNIDRSGPNVPLCQGDNFWGALNGANQHFGDDNFYIGARTDQPFINWYINDYQYYDRPSKTMFYSFSGSTALRISQNFLYPPNLLSAANDAAAGSAGVPPGALYRNGSVVMVKL